MPIFSSPSGVRAFGRSYSAPVGSVGFFSTYGQANSDNPTTVKSHLVDSSGNTYLGVSSIGSPNFTGWRAILIKVDPTGTILWKSAFDATGSDYFYDMTFDASQNIVITGTTQVNSGSPYTAYSAKFNQNGDLVQQNSISPTIYQQNLEYIPSTGGIYAVATDVNNYPIFIKYNSSGAVTWAKTISGVSSIPTSWTYSDGVSIYAPDYNGGLHALNSSGSFDWVKTFSSNQQYGIYISSIKKVTESSVDYLYLGLRSFTGTGFNLFFAKMKLSDFSIIWTRKLADSTAGSSQSERVSSIEVDPVDGSIYFAYSFSKKACITKHLPDGTHVWTKSLTSSNTSTILRDITITVTTSDLYVSGSSTLGVFGNYDYFFAKLAKSNSATQTTTITNGATSQIITHAEGVVGTASTFTLNVSTGSALTLTDYSLSIGSSAVTKTTPAISDLLGSFA